MTFDLTKPSPDAGHEGIRQAVVQAIQDLQLTGGDAQLGLDLLDMVFQFLDESAADNDAQRIRIDAVNIRCDTAIDGMDALQQRVAAIENRLAVLPGPDAAG